MLVRVSGDSMYPTYRDGDVVEVDVDAYVEQLPEAGDIVLAQHPFKGGVHIVKRVKHITDEGRVFVVGDSPLESSDSRGFGALRPAQILGKVTGTHD